MKLARRTVPSVPFRAEFACFEGTSPPLLTWFLKINEPAASLAFPRAFGGLEAALPAVVGAWRADWSQPPTGMFGDGSFGMTFGEIETVVRLGVPAILILFNDGQFGWIKGLHRLKGHNQTIGVDLMPTTARR